MSLQAKRGSLSFGLGSPYYGLRSGTWGRIYFRLEPLQILRNFAIACRDQLLVMTKRFQRLAERE
jgi:hypothetical protein